MIRDLEVVPKGITTSLHHKHQDELWTVDDIDALGDILEQHDFHPTDCMIESIPWTDRMKIGSEGWEEDCDRVCQIIRHLAGAGFRNATYNVMGVADWTRTDLSYRLPDGSLSLAFDRDRLATWDWATGALPGWTDIASAEDRNRLQAMWSRVSENQMFEALHACLERIIPVCQENDFFLSLHPDDPPYRVLDWVPRIVTDIEALRKIIRFVDSPHNGLCFCTGSLGVLPTNDLPKMVEELAPRINFLHLRPLKIERGGNFFVEVPHGEGDTPLEEVIRAAVKSHVRAHFRPDHAPSMDGTGLIVRPGESVGRPWRPGYDYKGRGAGLKWLDATFKNVIAER
jgi:mannonate dehydratase